MELIQWLHSPRNYLLQTSVAALCLKSVSLSESSIQQLLKKIKHDFQAIKLGRTSLCIWKEWRFLGGAFSFCIFFRIFTCLKTLCLTVTENLHTRFILSRKQINNPSIDKNCRLNNYLIKVHKSPAKNDLTCRNQEFIIHTSQSPEQVFHNYIVYRQNFF